MLLLVKLQASNFTPWVFFMFFKLCDFFYFFSVWIFFHEHLRITGLQGKGEGISLTPHYHFYLLHRYLDIIQVITAESSPLHIASSRMNREPLFSDCKSLTTKLCALKWQQIAQSIPCCFPDKVKRREHSLNQIISLSENYKRKFLVYILLFEHTYILRATVFDISKVPVLSKRNLMLCTLVCMIL